MLDQFLIKKPIVTEKSTDLSRLGQYVFAVKNDASSAEIKKILKKIYNVDVTRVNIVNVPGKVSRYGRVSSETKSGYKKAIVTVKKGQAIDVVPG